MISQLSIFAENTKGAMQRITQLLSDAGVNMNTLITNDSAEYGIVRMLVSDDARAIDALSAAGYMCRTDYVIAVEISDDCGSLNRLLTTMQRGNINIDYIYVTYSNLSHKPVAIMRTQDAMEVEEFLTGQGYAMVSRISD
ncbi:MAG: amino acid-binding protein [Clostridiales bacterium]|nr:amino acid-binding protein [Clostridiales bacterium]